MKPDYLNFPCGLQFVAGVWFQPHRDYGYYIEVDAEEVEDGLPGGVLQSLQHGTGPKRVPVFQPDYPHHEFEVSREQIHELVWLADQVNYSFTEQPHTPMLGGAFFGLRIVRAFHEAIILWQGSFEDQIPTIRRLYAAVQSLAGHNEFQ